MFNFDYIAEQIHEFQSYSDLKKSELFLNLELVNKVAILRHAQLKFNDIKDQITDDLVIFEKELYLGFFVQELIGKLNNFENSTLKIQYLEKNHEQLNILLIANKYKEISDIQYSEEFIKEKLNIINEFLDTLKPIPEVSIIEDALSINKNNIMPIKIEEIEHLAKSVTSKIVLLYELGIYEVLKKRIDSNSNNTIMDLARIIGYVIGNGDKKTMTYIYSLLSNSNLDPLNNNYHDESRDNPFTQTAIKEMKRILHDCNLQSVKEYPKKIKRIHKDQNKK